MIKVAAWPAEERRDLLREASRRRGLSFDVIQKDFWVCFALERLFSNEVIGNGVYFKGGTSLSKCFGLIERFSEDVDLTVSREALGFDEDYLSAAPTKTQEKKRRKKIKKTAFDYTSSTILPALQSSIEGILDGQVWELEGSSEGVIRFRFPSDPDLTKGSYLRPEVRLEVGGLSDLEPNESHTVTPYAAEEIPDAFTKRTAEVRVVLARRTLCDKLLLIHRLNTTGNDFPTEHSRHYYDVAMLSNSRVRTELLEDRELLASAIAYEAMTFPRSDVDYDALRPDRLLLVPTGGTLDGLRRDYGAMKEMFFNEPPSAEWLLEQLKALQEALAGRHGKAD